MRFIAYYCFRGSPSSFSVSPHFSGLLCTIRRARGRAADGSNRRRQSCQLLWAATLFFLYCCYFLWRLIAICSWYASPEVCLLQREAINQAGCATRLAGGTGGQVGRMCCFPKCEAGANHNPLYWGCQCETRLPSVKEHLLGHSRVCMQLWPSRHFSQGSQQTSYLTVLDRQLCSCLCRSPGVFILFCLSPQPPIHL